MVKRDVSQSAEAHKEDGEFAVDHLVGDPMTKTIGQNLSGDLRALTDQLTVWIGTARECSQTMTSLKVAGQDLNIVVQDLSQVALSQAGHRRSSLEFVRVLPRSATQIKALPLDRRLLEYEMLRDRAAAGNEVIAAEGEKLAEAIGRYRECESAHRDALIRESTAFNALQVGKAVWVAALFAAYNRVRELRPGNRSWAEAHFRQIHKAPADKSALPPEELPADGTPAA